MDGIILNNSGLTLNLYFIDCNKIFLYITNR